MNSICSVILAAGQGSRMGIPKSNLIAQNDRTFLEHIARMHEGYVEKIMVVVGAYTHEIHMPHMSIITRIINTQWKKGPFSSLQCALKSCENDTYEGYIIHPVDVICQSITIETLIQCAQNHPHDNAIIPSINHRGGHPIYISHALATECMNVSIDDPSARLDMQLKKSRIYYMNCNDPGIRMNINTPEDYDNWKNEINSMSL